jgi:uncharacterized protein YjbJ (UPF0337 family)
MTGRSRTGARTPVSAATTAQAAHARDQSNINKGKLKEIAGTVTGHRDLKNEGKDQQLGGKAREKLGEVEKVLGK